MGGVGCGVLQVDGGVYFQDMREGDYQLKDGNALISSEEELATLPSVNV